jgi:hypothetical protein
VRRLSANQAISVNLPIGSARHDVLDFWVVAVIDSVVALEPQQHSHMRHIPDRVRDCYFTFRNDHSLIGLKGHLYQRSQGDWRFKVTDPVAHPTDNCIRIRVCAPITVAPHDALGKGDALETETVNFGVDGVLVDGPIDWVAPERIRLSLSLLGEDEPVETQARLVARQGVRWDFKYEAMNADARNRLASFVIEYQRHLLRRENARYNAETVGLDDDLDL